MRLQCKDLELPFKLKIFFWILTSSYRKKKIRAPHLSQLYHFIICSSITSLILVSLKTVPKKGLIEPIIQCFSFKFNYLITNCLIIFLKEGKTRNPSLVHINKHFYLSIKCFQQFAFRPMHEPTSFCHSGLSPGH